MKPLPYPTFYSIMIVTAILCLIAPPSHGAHESPRYNFKSFLTLMDHHRALENGYRTDHDGFVKSHTNYKLIGAALEKLYGEENQFLKYRTRLKSHHSSKIPRRDRDRLAHYHGVLRRAIRQLEGMRKAFSAPLTKSASTS